MLNWGSCFIYPLQWMLLHSSFLHHLEAIILWSFLIFPIFPNFLIFIPQLVYTIFIINNHASFHLWWNETLVKCLKVSKYHKQGCLQNLLLFFMLLWQIYLSKTVLYFGQTLVYSWNSALQIKFSFYFLRFFCLDPMS